MVHCKIIKTEDTLSILPRLGIDYIGNGGDYIHIEYDYDFGWFASDIREDAWDSHPYPIKDDKYLRCQIVRLWVNHNDPVGYFDNREYYLGKDTLRYLRQTGKVVYPYEREE